MSKKKKTVFVCQECGYESPKWMGQCICGAWNSMVEETVQAPSPASVGLRSDEVRRRPAAPQKIAGVSSDRARERMHTGIGELDRVLGGGIVPGSMTLLSGEPGIGKSTIIMQAAQNIAQTYGSVLYVTGEESEEQVALRAERICRGISEQLYVISETEIEAVYDAVCEMKPVFLMIDSIQTMYSSALDSAPGSVAQVRACANRLMRVAKGMDIPTFLVAHVTKSGELAGPKTVEHMVDCVLSFAGERNQELRILRAFKNRFGTTSEIGVFEMGAQGLKEIEDISGRFLQDAEEGEKEGSVITAVYEGSRPLLMEVQALAVPSTLRFPRRTAVGIDASRLNMILAVLERRAGLSLTTRDVYINVAGGLRLEGTSADLAVALAVHSSCKGKPCSTRTMVLGEVGLTGEVRAVANIEKIIREAKRMGFKKILLPQSRLAKARSVGEGIELIGVKTVEEAVGAY